jgi:hypothetical protein
MANQPALPLTPPTPDRIRLAHEIATRLWDAGLRGPDGTVVLAMAMGIYMESQEGSHRNLKPINDALLSVAQQTFDAFQANKKRGPGHA